MTKEELAERLQKQQGINHCDREVAKDMGLIIISGYSDDSVDIDGFISNELTIYSNENFFITDKKVFIDQYFSDVLDQFEEEDEIRAFLDAKDRKQIFNGEFTDKGWLFVTELPHAKFTINNEDDEDHCLVLDHKDLKATKGE